MNATTLDKMAAKKAAMIAKKASREADKMTSSTSKKAEPKQSKAEVSAKQKDKQKLQKAKDKRQRKLWRATCHLLERFKKGLYFEPLAVNGAEDIPYDPKPFFNNDVLFQKLLKDVPAPRFITNTGITQPLDKNAPRRKAIVDPAWDPLAGARMEAVELARRFQTSLDTYHRPDVGNTVPRLISADQTVTVYRIEDVPAALQTVSESAWISRPPVESRDEAKETSRKFEQGVPTLLWGAQAKQTLDHKTRTPTGCSDDESWRTTPASSRDDTSDGDEFLGRHKPQQRHGTNKGAFWLMVGSDQGFEKYFVDTTNTRAFNMPWRKVGRSPLSQAQNCSEMVEEAEEESEDEEMTAMKQNDIFFTW